MPNSGKSLEASATISRVIFLPALSQVITHFLPVRPVIPGIHELDIGNPGLLELLSGLFPPFAPDQLDQVIVGT